MVFRTYMGLYFMVIMRNSKKKVKLQKYMRGGGLQRYISGNVILKDLELQNIAFQIFSGGGGAKWGLDKFQN